MSNRIHESFESYLDRVGLSDAGPEQVRDLRRAFFAGAWEVLCAVREVNSEGMSEGIARFEAMVDECEQFCARVVEGKD